MGLLNIATSLGYLLDATLVWLHTLLLMRVRTQGRGSVTDVSASATVLLLLAGVSRVLAWVSAPHMALLLKLDVEGVIKDAGKGDSFTGLLGAVLGGFYSRPGMHYAAVAASCLAAAAAGLWHGWSWHGSTSPGIPPSTILRKHDPASVFRCFMVSAAGALLYVLGVCATPPATYLQEALQQQLQGQGLGLAAAAHLWADAKAREGMTFLLLTFAAALTAAAVYAQCCCWVELLQVTTPAPEEGSSASSMLTKDAKQAGGATKRKGGKAAEGSTGDHKVGAGGSKLAPATAGYSEKSAGNLPQSGTVTAAILVAALWGVTSFLLSAHSSAHPRASPAFAAGVPDQPWAWGSHVSSHAHGSFVALALLLGVFQLRLRRPGSNRSAVGVLCAAIGVAALLPALMSNAALRRRVGVPLDVLGRPCMSGAVAGIVSAALMGGPASVVCVAAVAGVVNYLIQGVGGTQAAAMAAQYAGRNKGSFFTGH